MVELYDDLLETYLQSIRNRLDKKYKDFPNSFNPYTYSVKTKTKYKYLDIYIVLNGVEYIYKKMRFLDKMIFNVQSNGDISLYKTYHLRNDIDSLVYENIIL